MVIMIRKAGAGLPEPLSGPTSYSSKGKMFMFWMRAVHFMSRLCGTPSSRTVPAATLAIGDGANDVSMILAAHVGIGICG